MVEDKTKRINIRLTPSEFVHVGDEAKNAGVTVSDYGRRRLLGLRVDSRIDAEAIRELRRIGGLLRHLGIEVESIDHRSVARVLDELRDAIKRLGS